MVDSNNQDFEVLVQRIAWFAAALPVRNVTPSMHFSLLFPFSLNLTHILLLWPEKGIENDIKKYKFYE